MPVKTNVKISSLGYVIVYVKDTKKAVPFYRDTLGIKVRSEEDGWVELETGSTCLALHGEEKHDGDTGKGDHAHGQTVPVFNVDDFNGTYEALKAGGLHFEHEPMQVCEAGPGNLGMSVQFKDPDGNMLSIFGIVKK